MSEAWPVVPLGEVLTHRKELIRIDDTQEYLRCRVQIHAKGVVQRDRVAGGLIKTKNQQVCHAGEFLVAEIDAKVGGFGIIPPDLEGAIVSSHYFLFKFNPDRLDNRFLDYFSKTPAFRKQIQAQGSTNYAAIRPQHVLSYNIPLPPLAEQRRIVAKIEHLAANVEEARRLRSQTAEETDALLSATACARLADIQNIATPLREWLDPSRDGIQTGPFGAQLSSSEFTDSGCPVLTIGNIQYDGLSLSNLKFVSNMKAEALRRYRLAEGDILFARMGTVGRCCVVPPEASEWLINYHIIRVALDRSRVEPGFIHWTIRASRDIEEYLGDKIRGATRKGVNSKIVSELPVRIPPLPDQRRIVSELDALQTKVETLKHLQAETAAEIDALIQAMLDRAFKGVL